MSEDYNKYDEINEYIKHDENDEIIIPQTELTREMVKGVIYPEEYQIKPQYITSIKQQASSECWIFASLAMYEAYLLGHGMTTSADEYSELSVAHVAYSSFDVRDNTGKVNNSDGKIPNPVDTSGKTSYSMGGGRVDFQRYAAGLKGCVSAAEDPYYLPLASAKKYSYRDNDITVCKTRRFRIKEYIFMEDPVVQGDETFIDSIKYALMNYGVVYLGIKFVEDKIKVLTNDSKYHNTRSLYVKEDPKKNIGHGVAVVGWDDNFPVDKFTDTPGRPGAFKVKNSHGSGGDKGDGYLWVSYESFGLRAAAYIASAVDETDQVNLGVYRNNKFGMMSSYPFEPSKTKIYCKDQFTVKEDDEKLIAVGVCNFTPCTVSVSVIIGAIETLIVENYYLRFPGFHVIDKLLKQVSLPSKGQTFELKVFYENKTGRTAVFIPLERNYTNNNKYENLNLSNVKAVISDDGKTYTPLQGKNANYGSPAFYVYTTSDRAEHILTAVKGLSIPNPSGGRIDNLPESISGSGESFDVEWRVEPYRYDEYCGYTYTQPIKPYQSANVKGLINTTTSAVQTCVTAVIAKGSPYQMEKHFKVTIPAFDTGYVFSCTLDDKTKMYTLSGSFPVDGAKIYAKCNDADVQEATVKSGKWEIEDFKPYKAEKGWKDEYENSTVVLYVNDDKGMKLCEGTQGIKLEKPYQEESKAGKIVLIVTISVVGVGVVGGVVAAIVYCCKKCKEKQVTGEVVLKGITHVDMGEYHLLQEGVELGSTSLMGGGAEITISDTMADEGFAEMTDVTLRFRGRAASEKAGTTKNKGCFFQRMPDGAKIQNCKFFVTNPDSSYAAGIFYEGKNVMIENTEVHLDVTGGGDFKGIAHTLSGTIKNLTVDGKMTGQNFAGLSEEFSGTVTGMTVDMDVQTTGEVYGVCATGTNVGISNTYVHGIYKAGTKAAGVIGTMNGGSVSDVRISANIACSSDSGLACGVAADMSGDAAVAHAVVTGKLDAGGNGTAYGISSGIKDKPAAITRCVAIHSFIRGKTIGYIAGAPTDACIAYSGTKTDTAAIRTGEQLVTPDVLLLKSTYISHGFDFENTWMFVDKKKHIVLKCNQDVQYDYPFPNPYPTEAGVYIFNTNTPLALYGAASILAEKITWKNFSPEDGIATSGDTTYLLKDDSFYLEFKLMISEKGRYTVDVVSVIDGEGFGNTIHIQAKEG